MSTLTIEVQSCVFGSGQVAPVLESAQLTVPAKQITVAELIRSTVEEQLQILLFKRKLDAQQDSQVLKRQYLTAEEIKDQTAQGKVCCPSLPKRLLADPQDQVKRALQAFESNNYVILVGAHQVECLDEELTLTPETKVTFMRLMPLVGG